MHSHWNPQMISRQTERQLKWKQQREDKYWGTKMEYMSTRRAAQEHKNKLSTCHIYFFEGVFEIALKRNLFSFTWWTLAPSCGSKDKYTWNFGLKQLRPLHSYMSFEWVTIIYKFYTDLSSTKLQYQSCITLKYYYMNLLFKKRKTKLSELNLPRAHNNLLFSYTFINVL